MSRAYDCDENDENPMSEPCPMCNGPGEFIGILGGAECFRCRDCGDVFQTHTSPQQKRGNK